jgi:hypothetical protein
MSNPRGFAVATLLTLSWLVLPPLLGQEPPKAGTPAEPKWPHAFELASGEQTGFGFVAGTPGPIVVTVQWTGVPLVISLAKPGGGTIDQQGTGLATLRYNASAEDVKRGQLWTVSIRLAQEAPKPSGATTPKRIDRPTHLDLKPLAKGTVTVQHPAGDLNRVQAEVKARAGQAQPQKAQVGALPPVDQLALRQAEHQQQQVTRQAKLLEQVRPKLSVEAFQKLSRDLASSAMVVAKPGPDATKGGSVPSTLLAPVQKGTPAASASGGTTQGVQPLAGKTTTPPPPPPPRSGAGSTIPPPPPPPPQSPPVVSALSISVGQPGDPVLISGVGFSTIPGEVHVLVANGRDIRATATLWSDTQIVAVVPSADGIPAYNGQLYVSRRGVRSTLVPFRFSPATEFRTLGMATDKSISLEGLPPFIQVDKGYVLHPGDWWAFGAKGDDQFYLYAKLKNGWVVDSACLTDRNGLAITRLGRADAYISELRQGTDSPYLKVHWWRDGGDNGVGYVPHIVISGPKGVPHQ